MKKIIRRTRPGRNEKERKGGRQTAETIATGILPEYIDKARGRA